MTVKLRLIVEFSNTLMRWVLNDIWHCFGILLKKNVPTWLWAGLEVEELHLFVSQTRFGLVPYPSVVAVLSQVTNDLHHPKEITSLTITPHWDSNPGLKNERSRVRIPLGVTFSKNFPTLTSINRYLGNYRNIAFYVQLE